jgi:transposase InsO family protein
MEEIAMVGSNDATYRALLDQIRRGWPASKTEVEEDLKVFFRTKEHLMATESGLILMDQRLFIPGGMRCQVLKDLHAGHQGIKATTDRARSSVWWPSIHADIERTILACDPCSRARPALQHEPLQEGPRANRPFQRLHADLFEVNGQHYLAVVNEFSGWPCLGILGMDTSSKNICMKFKELFLAHMVPIMIKTDNGPQFVSSKTEACFKSWGVKHQTSSPRRPQTNGIAEAMVKKLKRAVQGSIPGGSELPHQDQLLSAILALRNSGYAGGRSPAEAVYGRKIREGRLPTHKSSYDPKWMRDFDKLDKAKVIKQERAQHYYDRSAKQHADLALQDQVMVRSDDGTFWETPAVVVEILPHHEYLVRKLSGRVLRRSRVLLRPRPLFLPGGSTLQNKIPTNPGVFLERDGRNDQKSPKPTPRRSTRTTKPNSKVYGESWTDGKIKRPGIMLRRRKKQ